MDIATRADKVHQRLDEAVENCASLRRLQRALTRLTATSTSLAELLEGLAGLLDRYAEPLAFSYFRRNESGELFEALRLRPTGEERGGQRLGQQLLSGAHLACRNDDIHIRQQSTPARTLVVAPVTRPGNDLEAMGAIFSSQHESGHLLMLVQLLASHVVLWQTSEMSRRLEADAADSAALAELLDQVSSAASSQQACADLAGQLAAYLGSGRVAIGLRSNGKGRCRLESISAVTRFDKRSTTAHALEAAMDEAVLRRDLTVWPPAESDPLQHAALAHKNLCGLDGNRFVVGTPLQASDDNTIGAIVVSGDADLDEKEKAQRFLRGGHKLLARALLTTQRAEGGRLTRLTRKLRDWVSRWQGLAALGAIALLALAMMIPVTHKLPCECTVEPVTRRFVAAPFEATLESALVKPGDIVRRGDVLARLDGRELRWKRAALVANRKRATKQRDAAQAAHSYADQQIAQLEIERLALKLSLLDYRCENLEIRSPIDGVVASGDLERAAGAPLTTGTTLFEIAPLDSMVVEIAVPDDDIAHLSGSESLTVRLDAFPRQKWRSALTRIQPRSEIRDDQNVFIAEAGLDNIGGQLRPGMKGQAKIETQKRTLGWILFHKPWAFITRKLKL